MRILFVVEHFYPYVGGAEVLFLNLAVKLTEQGFNVSVVTTLHDHALPKREKFKGIDIYRVNCYNRFLFTIVSIPTIIKLARNVDYIHTTSYNSAIPSFLAGIWCKKKVIITFHEVWGKLWFELPFTPKWKLFLYYYFEKSILKLPFYKYIAVSKFTEQSLVDHGVSNKKIVQIYNGINYKMFEIEQLILPSQFTVCYFGRLGISKGIDVLLASFKEFIVTNPNVKLKLIIPTYPKYIFNQVMKLISDFEIENSIILKHNLSLPQLIDEVKTSSCVVIPSHSEGFCYVAVESEALGVPIISSGKGSLAEVVSGKHLVLEKLNAESILDALRKAFKGEWEYKTPIKFHLNESVNEYIKLYQSIK